MEIRNVNKYTRAGRNGKNIVCPVCKNANKVYHFAWYALICGICRVKEVKFNGKDVGVINKEEWLIAV